MNNYFLSYYVSFNSEFKYLFSTIRIYTVSTTNHRFQLAKLHDDIIQFTFDETIPKSLNLIRQL